MNEADQKSLQDGIMVGSRYAMASPNRVAAGVAGGLLGQASGSSLEFMDHREYQPGDDIRRIDWSAYARTEKLILKLYREEITPHCDIILDTSLSMSLEGTEKRNAALTLAAALATAACNGGFSHALWLAGDNCQPAENGTASPLEWGEIEFNSREHLHSTLERLPPSPYPRALRILISDLLFPGDPSIAISRLSESASVLSIVQILAQSDITPPSHGNVRLVDSESGEHDEIYLDSTVQKRYRERLDRHNSNWGNAARQARATKTLIVAEDFIFHQQLPELIEAGILEVE